MRGRIRGTRQRGRIQWTFVQGTFREHSEIIQGTFREESRRKSGKSQGRIREESGNTK
jgi:hypothetical protein